MFDFANYRWYHWVMFSVFVIGLYWFWVLYLLVAVFWFTTATADSMGAYRGSLRRPRARARSTAYRPTRWRPKPFGKKVTKPYRAPRVRKPKVYKGRMLKSGMRSTYDPVFKKWRNRAKDSTWKPPPD